MKSKLKILIILGFCFLSIKTFSMDTAPIQMVGGPVKPGGTLTVTTPSTSKLKPKIYYDVKCDIINPNYQKEYPVILGIGTESATNNPTNDRIFLNGVELYTKQGLLNRELNKLEVFRTLGFCINGSCKISIVFQNLDSSDTVQVSNCTALPSHS